MTNKFSMQWMGMADDPTKVRPTLQSCIEAVLRHAETLMGNILDGLTLSLTQAKGKGTQLGQNAASKAAVAKLMEQPAAVKKTFATQLRQAAYHIGPAARETKPVVRYEELQLFEENEIDASIEFALAQQEVNLSVDDVLPTLNGFISSLMGWMTVQPQLNPLKPETFVRALRETLVMHVPSEEARSAIVTPAAGLLGVSLRQLYVEVAQWLRSHGVDTLSAPAGAGAAGVKAAGVDSISRTLLTLDKLRRLLNTEIDLSFGLGGGGGAGNEFNHTVPASLVALEDMKLIEPMMKRLQQKSAGQPYKVVGGGIRSDGAAAAPLLGDELPAKQRLGQQLGEEVVRLMLENLMSDARLPNAIRQQLAALEPVLLALSAADPRFFSDREHPARQFLDRVTHRSLAYSTEQTAGFTAYLASIIRAVQALVQGTPDAPAFATQIGLLEKGWTHDETEQRQRNEEAARALLRAEQRNMLAQSLATEFRERLKNKEVPEVISAFLCGPWAQVVAQDQLNCTDGSTDREGYMALVDDLIWSVRPRAVRHSARLVQLIPKLLVKVRQGLQLIGYPQERSEVFFDELIALHEKILDQARQSAAVRRGDKPAAAAGAQEEEEVTESRFAEMSGMDGFWVGDEEAQESGYLADDALDEVEEEAPPPVVGRRAGDQQPRVWSVADLSTGAWVELLVDGVWVRAQLTWASPHRTLFMFVSHTGTAHSMSRRTMEKLRARDQIRVVSDGRLLDNALDAVAQQAMRNKLEQPDEGD
jgi:hypothetical protein